MVLRKRRATEPGPTLAGAAGVAEALAALGAALAARLEPLLRALRPDPRSREGLRAQRTRVNIGRDRELALEVSKLEALTVISLHATLLGIQRWTRERRIVPAYGQ